MKDRMLLVFGALVFGLGLFLGGCVSYDSKYIAKGVATYCAATSEAERVLIRARVESALNENCPGCAISITCP